MIIMTYSLRLLNYNRITQPHKRSVYKLDLDTKGARREGTEAIAPENFSHVL